MLINLPSTAELRIKDPYTQFCRMAYPTEQYRTIALLLRNKDKSFDYHKALGFFTLHFSFFTYFKARRDISPEVCRGSCQCCPC